MNRISDDQERPASDYLISGAHDEHFQVDHSLYKISECDLLTCVLHLLTCEQMVTRVEICKE